MGGVAVEMDVDMRPFVGADLDGDLRAGAHLRASDLLHAGQRGDMVADGVDGHGLVLSAGGSGGGQHGLGTGDASGLVGVLEGSTYRPDGDIVKIEAIAAPGFQRLDEEMLCCDLEYQRLGGCWFGFGRLGHGLVSGGELHRSGTIRVALSRSVIN